MADLKALFANRGVKKDAEPQPAPASAPTPAESPAAESKPAPAKTGGFKIGKAAATAYVPSAPEQQTVATDKPTGNAGTDSKDAAGNQPSDRVSSIDSLAALGATTVGNPVQAGRIGLTSSFADETPATAPIRELPDDLTQGQKQFVDLIDGVYAITNEPDLVGNVIKSIMIELKSNPQYIKLISPDDVRMWIRAMRENMGLARIQKQETKTKRAGGKSKGKALDADMMAALDELGIVSDT